MNTHLFLICLVLYLLRFSSIQILGSSTESPNYEQDYNVTEQTNANSVTKGSKWWFNDDNSDDENNENLNENYDKNHDKNQDDIKGKSSDDINLDKNPVNSKDNFDEEPNKYSDDNQDENHEENVDEKIDENTEENIDTVSKNCPSNKKECLGCYNDWINLNTRLLCNNDIVATVQFKKSELLTCGELIIEKAVKGIDGNNNSQYSMASKCQNCDKLQNKTVCLTTNFESYDKNTGFNLGSDSYVVEGVCPNINCDTIKRSLMEDNVDNEDSVSIEKKSIVIENNNVTQQESNRESSALPESKNEDKTKDDDSNNVPIKGDYYYFSASSNLMHGYSPQGGIFGHSNGNQPNGQTGYDQSSGMGQSKHGYRSQPYYYDNLRYGFSVNGRNSFGGYAQMQNYGGLQRYGTSSVGYAQPPYGYVSGNRQQSGYENSYGPKSMNQSSYGDPSYNSSHGQYPPIYPQVPAYSVRSVGYGTNYGPSSYNGSTSGSYGQQLYIRGQFPYNAVRDGRQIRKYVQSSGYGGQQSSSQVNNYGQIEGNQSRYGRSSQDDASNYGQQSSDNNEGYAQQSVGNEESYGTKGYGSKSNGTSYNGLSEDYKQSIGNQQTPGYGGYGQYTGYSNQQAIGYGLNNRPFEYGNQPMSYNDPNYNSSYGYNPQIQGNGQSSGYSGSNYNPPHGLPLGGYNSQTSSFGQNFGYGSNYNSSYSLPSIGYNQQVPGYGQSSGYGGVYGQQTLGYNQQSSGYGDSNETYGYSNPVRYDEPSASYGPQVSNYKQPSGYGQQYGQQQQPSDYNGQQYNQQQPSDYNRQQYGQQYSQQQQPSSYNGQQYGQQYSQQQQPSGYNGQQYGQQPADYSNNYGSVGYGNQSVYNGSSYKSPHTQQPLGYGQQMPSYGQTSNYGSQPTLGYEKRNISGYNNFMPGYNSSYGESLEAYRQPFTNYGKLIKSVYNGSYGQPSSAYGTAGAFPKFGRNYSGGYEHQSYTHRPVQQQYGPPNDYYASSSNKLSINISSCPNILNSCPKCISHLNLDLVYKICSYDSIIISSFNNSNNRSHENTLNQQNTNVFCDKSLLHQVYKSSMKIDNLFRFAINNKCKCTNIYKDIQSKVIIFSKSNSWNSASITLDENVNIVRHSYMNQYDTERLLKRCAKV